MNLSIICEFFILLIITFSSKRLSSACFKIGHNLASTQAKLIYITTCFNSFTSFPFYLKEIWEPLIHTYMHTQSHMICILNPVNFMNQQANINHVQAKMKVLFEKYKDCKSIKFCWKILHLSDSIRKR